MADYWIFKVKTEEGGLWRRTGQDIFNHRAKELFWGIREYAENGRLETNVRNLKKGDCAVFYLVGKGGSSYLGTCVLDSGFEKLDPEKAKDIVHREFLDCETGVFLREVDRWAKPLPIECLRGKDSFVAGGGKFGSYFQGSIKMKNAEIALLRFADRTSWTKLIIRVEFSVSRGFCGLGNFLVSLTTFYYRSLRDLPRGENLQAIGHGTN